jgi:hypothetical protein
MKELVRGAYRFAGFKQFNPIHHGVSYGRSFNCPGKMTAHYRESFRPKGYNIRLFFNPLPGQRTYFHGFSVVTGAFSQE